MLKFTGIPFDSAVENELPEYDLPLYRRAGGIYYELLNEMREHNLACTGIITKLWYDYGYRYETLWSQEAQIYNDIYDYLFELARICDARGKTPAGFIDYIDSIASKGERLPDFDLPLERRQGVKIMTIHKSKGLEFPVVFVYGCGGRGQNVKNDGLVSFSREWGVSLNLTPPERFQADAPGNYFFELARETEKQKEEAELRRLLYVAMTRAEDTLVLTGVKNTKNNGVKSFIDLLAPVLDSPPDEDGEAFFSYEQIAPATRAGIRLAAARYGAADSRPAGAGAMREKAEAAAERYTFAGDAEKPAVLITQKPAGSRAAGTQSSRAATETDGALFDGLTPAEFGALVHRTIEERFAAGGASVPATGAAALADEYASVFFQSEIGQKSLSASYRKTEYAFLSLVEEAGVKKYVSGVIDLLFEAGDEMYIVDYKTDRTIDPGKYAAQLAAYARAVRDIFSKKTRAFLFYLREGRLVEM
jgi:ATP-dependent helicase/nuclease subunit A